MFGNVHGKYGLAQGDKDRMRRLAFVASIQFALPPIKKLERAQGISDLVAQIVRPAAIGIDVVEMLMKSFGEQPGNDVEVFVMMRGEPSRVFLCGGRRAARFGRVAHDLEFAGTQH